MNSGSPKLRPHVCFLVHRQSFIPNFTWVCIFFGKAIALILTAGSLGMGHVLGLSLFQSKYYSTGFMLDLADVTLLLL